MCQLGGTAARCRRRACMLPLSPTPPWLCPHTMCPLLLPLPQAQAGSDFEINLVSSSEDEGEEEQPAKKARKAPGKKASQGTPAKPRAKVGQGAEARGCWECRQRRRSAARVCGTGREWGMSGCSTKGVAWLLLLSLTAYCACRCMPALRPPPAARQAVVGGQEGHRPAGGPAG